MSLTLSNVEMEKIANAIRLLASPLDHAHVDHWRSAVNRCLAELLCADTAGFLLPVGEGLTLHSDEHDPAELAAYPDVLPPPLPDGTPMWARMIQSGVDTLANDYGREYHRYLGSEYYQDYAGANGAHDTLYAAFSLGGMDARGMAGLHFWHERPNGRLFGEREIAILRMVFPALKAGVESQIRWGAERDNLLHLLDKLGDRVLMCDIDGKVVHVTPSLDAALNADAEADVLRAELLLSARVVREASQVRLDQRTDDSNPLVRELQTASARYRATGCLYPDPSGRRPLVLVRLEPLTPGAVQETKLQEAFSLTPAEARVAARLADGRSNAEVACDLFISPHTAKRHTERVLSKMNVRSRAEVAARIHAVR